MKNIEFFTGLWYDERKYSVFNSDEKPDKE